jgi:hypothetical protein
MTAAKVSASEYLYISEAAKWLDYKEEVLLKLLGQREEKSSVIRVLDGAFAIAWSTLKDPKFLEWLAWANLADGCREGFQESHKQRLEPTLSERLGTIERALQDLIKVHGTEARR